MAKHEVLETGDDLVQSRERVQITHLGNTC